MSPAKNKQTYTIVPYQRTITKSSLYDLGFSKKSVESSKLAGKYYGAVLLKDNGDRKQDIKFIYSGEDKKKNKNTLEDLTNSIKEKFNELSKTTKVKIEREISNDFSFGDIKGGRFPGEIKPLTQKDYNQVLEGIVSA